ncbi:nitronate monooxygenase [Variovorax boronicumulans]|uniref:nitronate monooxygenase n=1 Tax=Variovorax boronicumulans TaxID=436515 RepID=UPI001C57789E
MIQSPLCRTLGIDFPLFAFTHCRDVVVEVSKAGGFGVLGAVGHTPEELEAELNWIDAHIDGRPYGLDVLIPENLPGAAGADTGMEAMARRIPEQHSAFVRELLQRHGVQGGTELRMERPTPFLPENAERQMDVAFRHPIRLIANALGVPPPSMIERARRHGIPVAALVGAKEHALRQVEAGVDIIVAQGGEAGGHCGEVSTMVLIPEVVRALRGGREVPVLAAGGIMTGEQMAACMAMGAAGAWTGSVWLPTRESECSETVREKLVAAGSRDTVRSRSRTGKPARQLRSAWTEAWEAPGSPGCLPMPLQPCSAARRCARSSRRPTAATHRRANSPPISSARASAW